MNIITKDMDVNPINSFSIHSGLNLEFLPVEDKLALEQRSKTVKARKKSVLYREGESPRGLYILLKGKVKLSRLNPDGSEQIFFIYASGDIFGYRPILAGTRHTHSVIAIEECELLFVEKEEFLTVIKGSDGLLNLFLGSICREFTLLTNMINVLTKKSIRERTAYFLLLLNEKYKLPGQLINEAEIKVSRTDLASYIGASIENLIRTIREFKDKNYVQVDGKSIYIRNFEALYSLVDFKVNRRIQEPMYSSVTQ
jgi:CRP-like cAMP-binding protein